MSYKSDKVIEICLEIDLLFQKQGVVRHSLSPKRVIARSFYDLGNQFFSKGVDEALFTHFCLSFYKISKAQLYHFPQNIFWDTDYLFFSAFKEMAAANNPLEFLGNYTTLMLKLLALFGTHSAIKFRYLHDFTYGFDWAKWVKKDAKARNDTHPFSFGFLQRMYLRGKELEILIKDNDTKYHQLGTENQFRNPFLFIRNPKEEKSLLKQLVASNLIPVKAWEMEEAPVWEKHFHTERNKLSTQLGFKKQK